MKKNGFTLIELIATIGILGMLATLVITVSVKKINETKEKSRDTMIESIELAAKNYVIDYKDELTDFNKYDYIYITLQTLVEKEYFTNSLVDPTTEKSLPLSDEVYVVRESNGNITAIYDINQRQKAKIVLNGAYNEYLKKGETFTDLGITATSENGTDVSESVTTSGTVNTNTPGSYTITYKYDDITITRNVIVYDGNLPSIEVKPIIGASYIENLLKDEATLNNGLVQTTATINGETVDAGIRYAGATADVKNKVYFNCEPTDGTNAYGTENYDYESSCELWRIIGVFDTKSSESDTEGTPRIKIVRDSVLDTTMEWDTTADGVTYVNQWGATTLPDETTPYPGASLMQYLNIGDSSYYSSLSSIAKGQIGDAVWYTGAVAFDTASGVYEDERSSETGTSTAVNYTTKWVGKIGLIYTSDFGYAGTNCGSYTLLNYDNASSCGKTRNWLTPSSGWYWTISPGAFYGVDAWLVDSGGYAYYDHVGNTFGVRPALYLSSNVQIIGGDGSTVPYKLK